MNPKTTIGLSVALIIAAGALWWAQTSPKAPDKKGSVAPKPVFEKVKQPYALNYTDEAAQTLGFQDGHMEVFSSHPDRDNPLIPVFSGGISGNGAMLRLQWRPGQ